MNVGAYTIEWYAQLSTGTAGGSITAGKGFGFDSLVYGALSIALLLSQGSARRENTLPALLVIPNKACLAAVYWTMPGTGIHELSDTMLAMTPRPRSRSTASPWHTQASSFFIA